MLRMSDYKISTRVYAGFGSVLALLLLVAVIGISSLGEAQESMTSYEGVATNAVRVANINAHVSEMRRNVVRFVETGTEASLKAIRDNEAGLKEALPLAIAATIDSTRLANLQKMEQLFKEYIERFNKVPDLRAAKEKGVRDEMNVYGAQARKNLTEIMKTAEADNDFEASAMAGGAQEALMLTRLSAIRFLADPTEENFAAMHERLPAFLAKAKKLAERLNNGTRKKLANETLELAEKYDASFKRVGEAVNAVNKLVNKEMADRGVEFAKLAEETLITQEKALAATKETTFAMMEQDRDVAGLLAVLALLIGGVLAYVIGRGITHPILNMTHAMTVLAEGDKTVVIPAQDNKDEIGEMAKAVQVFKNNAIEKERLELEQEEQKRRTEEERRAAMREMADSFESHVGGVIQAVTSATVELQASARQMAATATETSAQATTVASAAEESSSNVQAVASASEELATSIREIASQVERSRSVATKATSEAGRTSALIEKLSEHVAGIGEIVSMITDIASQTNLLALNATIEAARAGEAGKGFAVVASEVKNLAAQTAKATEEVSSRISAIQSGTTDAVKAISSITQVISEMSNISGSVAAAVEEQGAATGEISRNVEQAAAGTREVSANITSVETASHETGAAATQISNAANDLSEQSERLKMEVHKFLDMVRSDKESLRIMEWDESLSIDKGILDNHHKRIIEQVNLFFGRMMTGDGLKGANDMLDTLGKTFQKHFDDEERMMEINRYPDLPTHRAQHQAAWESYKQMRAKIERGEAEAPRQLFEFVANWLKDHIGCHDKALADFLRAKERRAA